MLKKYFGYNSCWRWFKSTRVLFQMGCLMNLNTCTFSCLIVITLKVKCKKIRPMDTSLDSSASYEKYNRLWTQRHCTSSTRRDTEWECAKIWDVIKREKLGHHAWLQFACFIRQVQKLKTPGYWHTWWVKSTNHHSGEPWRRFVQNTTKLIIKKFILEEWRRV